MNAVKWRNGLIAVLGAWFIVAPWFLGFSTHAGALWLSIILGAVQLLAAASVWMRKDDATGYRVWQSWTTLVTGIWFILQPFVLALSQNGGEAWTGVIFGAVTGALALWNMGAKHPETPTSANIPHGGKANA